MYETFNESGLFKLTPESRINIKLRTASAFLVLINGSIVGPNSDYDRYLCFDVEKDSELVIETADRFTIAMAVIPENAETGSTISMVNPDEEPLTLEEKLREEMQIALNKHGMLTDKETVQESNDFNEDDDDYDNPLSSYELELMKEEYLSEKAYADSQKAQAMLEINTSSDVTPPAETTTQTVEQTTTTPTS